MTESPHNANICRLKPDVSASAITYENAQVVCRSNASTSKYNFPRIFHFPFSLSNNNKNRLILLHFFEIIFFQLKTSTLEKSYFLTFLRWFIESESNRSAVDSFSLLLLSSRIIAAIQYWTVDLFKKFRQWKIEKLI